MYTNDDGKYEKITFKSNLIIIIRHVKMNNSFIEPRSVLMHIFLLKIIQEFKAKIIFINCIYFIGPQCFRIFHNPKHP